MTGKLFLWQLESLEENLGFTTFKKKSTSYLKGAQWHHIWNEYLNKATFQSASKKFKLADIVMTGVSARIIFLSMRFVIWSVGDVFYAPFVNIILYFN